MGRKDHINKKCFQIQWSSNLLYYKYKLTGEISSGFRVIQHKFDNTIAGFSGTLGTKKNYSKNKICQIRKHKILIS